MDFATKWPHISTAIYRRTKQLNEIQNGHIYRNWAWFKTCTISNSVRRFLQRCYWLIHLYFEAIRSNSL